MTTPKDDGGPAFPTPYDYQHEGMNLRDWFAGMAMQGYLAGRNINALDCSFYTCEKAARSCYGYADAMLAARKEGV